jgi:hypothetical protein
MCRTIEHPATVRGVSFLAVARVLQSLSADDCIDGLRLRLIHPTFWATLWFSIYREGKDA